MTRSCGWMTLVVVVGSFVGCGPPRVASSDSTLNGAKFDIPVYPGARVQSTGSPTTFHRGDPASPTAYDGLVWQLAFRDPTDKVVAYYDTQLRSGRRLSRTNRDDASGNEVAPIDDGAGSESSLIASYRYKPTGAVQDEEVTIDIYEDRRIEIAQVTLKE